MIMARPFGIIRSAFFFSAFIAARIPLWFVIIASLINKFISPTEAVAIIIIVALCRSYIESEIAGSGFAIFITLRILRFFKVILAVVAIYAVMIYYTFAADSLDKALIAVALIIVIFLYENKPNHKDGYWNGYKIPAGAAFVTSLLWLYLSFVPDSLFGNMSILLAIYIIEFINLIQGTPLSGLDRAKNKTDL